MTRQAISQCGATSASSQWSSIDWHQVEDDVFRFQMRIYPVRMGLLGPLHVQNAV